MKKGRIALLAVGMVAAAVPVFAASADTDREIEQLKERLSALEEARPAGKSAFDLNSKALKLYGQMRVSVDNHSGDWKSGSDGTSIVSNASRIGAKGSYESGLGDSSVIYQAELRYETTDSVNGTAGKQVEFREGYGGLASPTWGRLRLGRLSTAYKTTLTKIDPWNDNAPQSRSGGRQGSSELHSSYFNNAVDYLSPKVLGGLRASLWYASEFDNDANPLHNTGTLKNYTGGSAAGAGLKYSRGPLFIGADYIDIDSDNITKTGLVNDSGWQVAGRYRIAALSVAAMYEDVKDLGLGRNAYVNAIYKLGPARFIAAYGTNRDAAVYKNDKYYNYSLGVKYALKRKSELFIAWNSRNNDTKNTNEDTLTVGINAKFGY